MSISVTSPCPETTIEELGIKSWPIWTCEASSFDWTYDEKETCLLLEGEVTVTPEGGDPVKFGAGGLVVFPQEWILDGIFIRRSASIIDLVIKLGNLIQIR